MKHKSIKFFFLLALVIVVASCEVSDPGSTLVNRPPTTAISSAPQNGTTVNHYLTLHWSGNDGDGEVAGFNMYIDGELVTFTTRTDSAISFNSPSTGEIVSHTFKIQAVDDDGEADPNPPEIQFFTSNTAPTCIFSSDNTVRNNSNVGQGFRLKLEAEDGNRSGIEYAISIDDTNSWTAWSTDSVFMFADSSLGIFPVATVILPISYMTAGSHTIYARCRDSGYALSPIVSREVNVSLGHRPVMAGIPSRYNYGVASDSLYPDGSIYRNNNAQLILAFEANVSPYRGVLHSYRYRQTSGHWSPWQSEPDLVLTNLPLGFYEYEFQARDIAGALSDTAIFFANLLEQEFTDSILVVDDTRGGTGQVNSPTEANSDAFYASLLEGYNVRHIDLADRNNPSNNQTAYVSPFDLKNIGLVLWHADDKDNTWFLRSQRRILSEYMQRGGRVIFSGWDLMTNFHDVDTMATYSGAVFQYKYMRAFSAARPSGAATQNAQVTGFISENGFPSVQIDPAKVLPSWAGSINRSWSFEPRGECTVIGRATTRDPNFFQNGEVVAYYYDLSYRVAVFGVPLYFCQQSQVQELFTILMPRMLTGL